VSDNVNSAKVPTPWAVQRCRHEAGKSDGGFPPVILATANRVGFQRPAFTGVAASATIIAKKPAAAAIRTFTILMVRSLSRSRFISRL
jgi:hypothetical protein